MDHKLSAMSQFFSDSSVAYFPGFLTVYTPFRQLRFSADTWILRVPLVRTKMRGLLTLVCAIRRYRNGRYYHYYYYLDTILLPREL